MHSENEVELGKKSEKVVSSFTSISILLPLEGVISGEVLACLEVKCRFWKKKIICFLSPMHVNVAFETIANHNKMKFSTNEGQMLSIPTRLIFWH